MSRPPFDVIRACFYLVAIVIAVMMLETLVALLGCVWTVSVMHTEPMGSCASMGGQIRDIMSELLTTILALIASSRGGRPPPPPDGQ